MRRRNQSNRPFVIAFVLTVVVLSGVVVGLLLTKPSVQFVQLPKNVPEYTAIWGKYVPSTALLFGFENYTQVRRFASYPLFDTLINIPDLRLRLSGSAMNGILTIVLRTPNATVDVAFVNSAAFSNFTNAFAGLNSSAVRQGDNSMYYVRNYFNGQFQYGWIALIPSDKAIAFSPGSETAKRGIQECLDVQQGAADSVISRLDIRQMLYIVNGTTGHLAVGLQDFAGVVNSSASTLTVVDATGSSAQVRRLIEFNDAQTALAQWTDVRSAYLNAHEFAVYGSFVEATELGPIAQVTQYVRLVE